jgi:hypothetical protein
MAEKITDPVFLIIQAQSTQNDKLSWKRKMNNMVGLLAKLRPIEHQITDLMAQKLPIVDEISALRIEMQRGCIHPIPNLVNNTNGTVTCKFCNKTLNVVTHE